MFSIINRIARAFKVAKHPAHWFNPKALPNPPILIFTPQIHTSPKKVHWSQDILQESQTSQDQQAAALQAFGFSLQTGTSYLPEHDGDISWDTIKASTEDGYDLNQVHFDSSISLSSSKSNWSLSSCSNPSIVITDYSITYILHPEQASTNLVEQDGDIPEQ
ncbi:hypothetical protein C0991_008471, partial [Blastosporella zonata]